MIVITNEPLCCMAYQFNSLVHYDSREATCTFQGYYYCDTCRDFLVTQRRFDVADFKPL